MQLSGAQIVALLEQQFAVKEILLPSASLTYTYLANPDGGPHVQGVSSADDVERGDPAAQGHFIWCGVIGDHAGSFVSRFSFDGRASSVERSAACG